MCSGSNPAQVAADVGTSVTDIPGAIGRIPGEAKRLFATGGKDEDPFGVAGDPAGPEAPPEAEEVIPPDPGVAEDNSRRQAIAARSARRRRLLARQGRRSTILTGGRGDVGAATQRKTLLGE